MMGVGYTQNMYSNLQEIIKYCTKCHLGTFLKLIHDARNDKHKNSKFCPEFLAVLLNGYRKNAACSRYGFQSMSFISALSMYQIYKLLSPTQC
jgi:hypothetical protein